MIIDEQVAPQPSPKKRRKRHPKPLNPSADAFSIKSFCEQHEISEALYFQLQADGVGPRIMRVGGRVLISREAAAQWRRKREAAAARRVARYRPRPREEAVLK
jgi:hypothetical protein